MVVLYKFGSAGGVPLIEEPIGDKDNSNREFITTSNIRQGSLRLYYNGQLLTEGVDFDVLSSNVIMLRYIAPHNEDILNAIYYKE